MAHQPLTLRPQLGWPLFFLGIYVVLSVLDLTMPTSRNPDKFYILGLFTIVFAPIIISFFIGKLTLTSDAINLSISKSGIFFRTVTIPIAEIKRVQHNGINGLIRQYRREGLRMHPNMRYPRAALSAKPALGIVTKTGDAFMQGSGSYATNDLLLLFEKLREAGVDVRDSYQLARRK